MKRPEIMEKVANLAPAYCKLIDDGVNYHCPDCEGSFHAKDMLYLATPDGKKHVCCVNCVDKDWLKNATYVQGAV